MSRVGDIQYRGGIPWSTVGDIKYRGVNHTLDSLNHC